MPRTSDARRKIVRAACSLFREQGYAATSWREVIRASGAPWGSQAHYFPHGKEQLGVDAIDRSGAQYEQLLLAVLSDTNPADAVATWVEAAAAELAHSGWRDGCPVATVALETSAGSDALGAACHRAFDSWRHALGQAMSDAGADPDEAQRLAILVLSGIEGGLLLARAQRDTEPLTTVGAELVTLLRHRLPISAPPT